MYYKKEVMEDYKLTSPTMRHFKILKRVGELWIEYDTAGGSIPGLERLWMTFKEKNRTLVIDWIRTKEEEQRRGVGRKAIEIVEQLARDLGAKRIVGRGAKKSHEFWEKMGYTVVPQAHQRPRIYKNLNSEPTPPKAVAKSYLYHGTTQGALRKIATEGIKPTAMGQVSVSSTEQYAKTYADRKGGARGIVLRVKDEGQFVPDDRISVAGDYLTRRAIKPEDIEVKMPDGSWVSLSSVDVSLGIPELGTTNRPQKKRTRTIKSPPRPRPASMREIR